MQRSWPQLPYGRGIARVVGACSAVLRPSGLLALTLGALLASSSTFAQVAAPEKAKLPPEVEKAFADFIGKARESRKAIAKGELAKLCDEVARTVKLSDEQRKKLEAEAGNAITESCDKFAEKLDAWLRPFLSGFGDSALRNLERWSADQFAGRPNVASSPQDTTAWDTAVKSVLNPSQLDIYQQELGDKTARRKKEIAIFLKEALTVRRGHLTDAFKLEREGVVRELSLDKDRSTKLEAAEKAAVDAMLTEDEAAATKQFLELNEESWRQLFGSGGTHQFDNNPRGPISKREGWKKALASVLTPEEMKQWDEMLVRRQQRRDAAAKMGAVAELEDRILLTADQRVKLEKIFLENWKRYPVGDNNPIQPLSLLRSGSSDKEIRTLLTPDQQKRWDEFLRGGYTRVIDSNSKPSPESAPPEDTEQIFAAHLVKLYHGQRDRMLHGMQERVDELVRVAKLSGAPLKQVELAAKGAVERSLDTGWKAQMDRNVRGSVEGVGPALLRQRLESMGESRQNVESPDQHPLWVQALNAALTEEQRKAYEVVLMERHSYRDGAIVQMVLAQLDTTLRLSGEQSDKLEPLLRAAVQEYWPDYKSSFSGNTYAIYPFYLAVMLWAVPEDQRKAILTPEQVKQFQSDSQNRYSGWWDNIRRKHDERLRAKRN